MNPVKAWLSNKQNQIVVIMLQFGIVYVSAKCLLFFFDHVDFDVKNSEPNGDKTEYLVSVIIATFY